MRHQDIATGLFWLFIGLGLTVWTLAAYEIGSLTQPGTGYLPLALGIILVLLSLALLIGQIRKKAVAAPQAAAPAFPSGWKRVLYTVVVLLAAALALERLGYLLTFFVMALLLMKGVERQSWARILLTALLTIAGVYVVFVLLLEVQLPRGILGV